MCAYRVTELNPLLLRVDELEYELKIRGVPFVRTSSKELAVLLTQHTDHTVKEEEAGKLLPQKELRALKPKVAELEVLMSKSCFMQVDPSQLRLVSLYLHLVGRITRCAYRALDGSFSDLLDLAQRVSVVSKHLLALCPDLAVPAMNVDRDLIESPEVDESVTAQLQALSLADRPRFYPPQSTPRASRWPPNMSAQSSDDGLPNLHGCQTVPLLSRSERQGAVPAAKRRRTPMRFCHYNPVSRWTMRYDGGEGLAQFLQQVEDAAEAHDVTHEELVRSLGDLLTGPAKVWFRANRKEITSWSSCKQQMDEAFLPPDIDSFLIMKLRTLHQKPGETYIAFEARADVLFQRMRKSLDERQRIRILLKGMHPYYKTKMHTSEVHSLRDLRHLCKTVDVAKALKWTLERDGENKKREKQELQLRAPTVHPTQINSPAEDHTNVVHDMRPRNPTPAIQCWRCSRYGHSAIDCGFQTFCKVCGSREVAYEKCFNCEEAEDRGLWSSRTNNWSPYGQEFNEMFAEDRTEETPVPGAYQLPAPTIPATVMNPGPSSPLQTYPQRLPMRREPEGQGNRAPAQARLRGLFGSREDKHESFPKRP